MCNGYNFGGLVFFYDGNNGPGGLMGKFAGCYTGRG